MLQAMNTGHPGSMCTLHANSPRDALIRLENMLLMGGGDIPLVALRRQIASSIDMVVQLARLRSGHRCVTSVDQRRRGRKRYRHHRGSLAEKAGGGRALLRDLGPPALVDRCGRCGGYARAVGGGTPGRPPDRGDGGLSTQVVVLAGAGWLALFGRRHSGSGCGSGTGRIRRASPPRRSLRLARRVRWERREPQVSIFRAAEGRSWLARAGEPGRGSLPAAGCPPHAAEDRGVRPGDRGWPPGARCGSSKSRPAGGAIPAVGACRGGRRHGTRCLGFRHGGRRNSSASSRKLWIRWCGSPAPACRRWRQSPSSRKMRRPRWNPFYATSGTG